MPSEAPALPTQTEKPQHYMYLKEFRTQQCPLFLQHKCTQHRPYTCFHWHFMNQRRRRPIRKRDGTFNYSPDVYCTKYDETTGICPEGDECPFLHRTAGDTERRYHLRYYKTCTCVHETDAKGHCVKNGPHCAFAHGAHDLRPPVYDIRELQALNGGEKGGLVEAPSAATQLERDRIINEDPRWNDTNYVLANYKTEQCKRPPRLCRQGYACPQYHNNRDRRRSPKKFKYRSTPCPNVKHGDEWGDSAQCDSGDNCPYCHTRTEQQFHPEIYKSSKCNDMVQTGYCPRGPFCAFAHVEQEMTTQRDLPLNDNSLAAFVTNILPVTSGDGDSMYNQRDVLDIKVDKIEENNRPQTSPRTNGSSGLTNSNRKLSNSSPGIPEPIGKGRSLSTSTFSDGGCWKAPGSERDDPQAKLRIHLQAIDNDPTLDCTEKSKRKQNLLLLHNLSISNALSSNLTTALGSTPTTPSSTVSSTMSPHAPSFYPPGDTVESVIGNALEEDLDLGELSLSSIDKDLAKDNDDTNSVSSSISAGLTYNAGYLGTSSVPVTIPSSGIQRGSIGSLSPTSSSPMATFTSPFFSQVLNSHRQEHPVEQAAAAAFMCQPNTSKQQVPPIGDYNSMSPRNGLPQSPLMSSSFTGNVINGNSEVQRLREELATNKIKLAQWEDRIAQARSVSNYSTILVACDAWKKEAEESMRKAKQAEEERLMVIKQRDEAIQQVAQLKQELDRLPSSPYLHCLQRISELETLPAQQIKHIQSQLRQDLETVEKVIFQYTAYKCMVCQEKNRNIIVLPCNHFVLCDGCASKRNDCSFCHTPIAQRTPMVLPM